MKYGVQAGFFQPVIHVGRLNKEKTAFAVDKEEATDVVIRAVADLVKRHYNGGLSAEYSDYDVEVFVTPKEPKGE